jgi:lysophospholipase L1-like esterase
VQAFPGATIAAITNHVQSHKASIARYDAVIFHVGTNDLCSKPVSELLALYTNLIAVTRKESKSIKIILSSILPRPVDFGQTKAKSIDVNNQLKSYLCPRLNVQFVSSY